jgi:hypothetical protein
VSRLADLDFYAENFNRLLAAVFLAGFLLFVASAFLGTGADVIVGDSREYFEYARSLAATGRLPAEHIKYPLGVALIGSVLYLPAAAVAKLLVAAGLLSPSERITSGWALPLQVAFCLPFLALAFIALRANVGTFVRLGYAPRVVKPMTLFWVVATNVGFYVLKEPAMSEASTYATLSLYYWALIRWFYLPADSKPAATPKLRHAVVVGLFLGLAGTIRQQNILHAVALPLLLISQSNALFGPERRIAASARVVGVAALSSGALFVIPWAAWYVADGELRLFSYGGEQFNFLSPHPLDALFHPGYHGLFVWNPAFAIAAVGLVFFLRDKPGLRHAWTWPIAIQFYLIASWYWLSFGASVGHRGFFTILPLLLGGWIAAGNTLVDRGKTSILLVGVAALTAANAFAILMLMTGRWSSMGLPPR